MTTWGKLQKIQLVYIEHFNARDVTECTGETLMRDIFNTYEDYFCLAAKVVFLLVPWYLCGIVETRLNGLIIVVKDLDNRMKKIEIRAGAVHT